MLTGAERAERREASEVPPLRHRDRRQGAEQHIRARAEQSEASEVPPFRQSPITHTDLSLTIKPSLLVLFAVHGAIRISIVVAFLSSSDKLGF